MYLIPVMPGATKEKKCPPGRLTEFFCMVRRGMNEGLKGTLWVGGQGRREEGEGDLETSRQRGHMG